MCFFYSDWFFVGEGVGVGDDDLCLVEEGSAFIEEVFSKEEFVIQVKNNTVIFIFLLFNGFEGIRIVDCEVCSAEDCFSDGCDEEGDR